MTILVAACLTAPGVQAQADESGDATLERRVKAAFLFKFASFIDWPPDAFAQADSPIRIAVMGDDAMAQDVLEASMNRTVEGRRVEVRPIAAGDTLDGVNILFLRDAAAARLGGSIADLEPRAILVVTESAGGLRRGSVINFVLDGGRVRFDISLDEAARRGIRLSSRLITVARQVLGGPR